MSQHYSYQLKKNLSIVTLQKNIIHQVTTMLATSKNVPFQVMSTC